MTGPYCVARIGTTKSGDSFFQNFDAVDIDQLAFRALEIDSRGQDVYFAVGALAEGRFWDSAKQKWRVRRTGENIRALRSYIFDLDAGPDRQFATVEDALRALKDFVKATRLPVPTIVHSGNGLHVYWTLEDEVPPAVWRAHGQALISMAAAHGLRIDTKRTADVASVLRVPGTHNYKYADPLQVVVLKVGNPTSTDKFHELLGEVPLPTATVANDTFGSNTNRYDGPPTVLSLREGVANCAALAHTANPENQKQGRAAIPEPAWFAAMLLAAFMHNGRAAAHLISKFDPRYDHARVEEKFDQLVATKDSKAIGPTTCAEFEEAYATIGVSPCSNCPSRGKIKTPAMVMKYVPKAQPQVVQEKKGSVVVVRPIPEMPPEFHRLASGGIGIKTFNSKTSAPEVLEFCAYNMYPVRLRYDERTLLEDDVRWRVKLPKEEWFEVDVPHVGMNQIRTTLAKRGIYIDEPHIPHMTKFMSAYMRKLQTEIPRERAYSKLGWRSEGFVLGGTLFKPDGTSEEHCMSNALQSVVGDAVAVAGSLEQWKWDMQMYNRDQQEAHRIMLYSGGFASVLYPFTGQIATCVSATGVSGVGKSTLMEACASVWGDPTKLIVRGAKDSSTRAAAEVLADAMHNLPVFMDELTDRDPKDVAALIFNYSGGKGKIRSTATGGIRGDTATWSNLLMLNANTDEYDRIAGVFRDSTQHMVRLVQVEFYPTTTVSKYEGDELRLSVRENFGHAGRIYAEYLAANRDDVKKRVRAANVEIDRIVNAKPEERFWTGWMACVRVGAEIAEQLGLLQGFPISSDMEWLYKQMSILRKRTHAQTLEPGEAMSEFLETQNTNILTLSAKGSNNIDNVLREPRGELTVRYEVDTGLVWVNRAAFRDYCTKQGVNFSRAMDEMDRHGYIRRYSVMKVLGADTTFSKGRVRCIELDMHKMGGKLAAVTATASVPARAIGSK